MSLNQPSERHREFIRRMEGGLTFMKAVQEMGFTKRQGTYALNRWRPDLKRLPLPSFWDCIDKSDENGCWPWKFGTDQDGYGKLTTGGQTVRAHRRAFELANDVKLKPFEFNGSSETVCHSCDNPPCCNPTHLFLGTVVSNRMDCVQKRRHSFGETHGSRNKPESMIRGVAHHNAKLTPEKVLEIRSGRAAGVTVKALATRFGVGRTTINRLLLGETWRHVLDPEASNGVS